MIRGALLPDIPRLVVMGVHFIQSTQYAGQIGENPDALFDMMLKLIEAENAVIFVDGETQPIGMLGAHIFQHPMSGELVASELFWWVEPEHRGNGLALYRALEGWAEERGVHKIQMVAPDERTSRVYCALGFTKVEELYQKAL